MNAARSLAWSLLNVLHPRMLWLMIWPMLLALLVWGVVAFLFWVRTALWLASLFSRWLDAASFLASLDTGHVTLIAANVLLFLLFVPIVYLTTLFILGVFGMQAMVEHVARRAYPALERRGGGAAIGSGWNAMVALLGMLLLALVTLPLWVVPPLWPVIPVAILGWGNQRLLRYDALSAHAAGEEMRRVFREHRGALYLLGALLALIAYVPLLGFVAPVWFGLAFIHYLLGALAEERAYHRPGPNDASASNARQA